MTTSPAEPQTPDEEPDVLPTESPSVPDVDPAELPEGNPLPGD